MGDAGDAEVETRGWVRPTMKMLAGLMSRWIRPFECANASASATRRMISAACAGVARHPSWRAGAGPALEQLHRDVGALVADAGVEDGHDVRMAQAAGRARFVQEQRVERLALLLGNPDVQRLDGDQARQQRIVRSEDRAEAAFAELVLERVPADVADCRDGAIGRCRDESAERDRRRNLDRRRIGVAPQPDARDRGCAQRHGFGVGGGHGRRGRAAHCASLSDPTAGAP